MGALSLYISALPDPALTTPGFHWTPGNCCGEPRRLAMSDHLASFSVHYCNLGFGVSNPAIFIVIWL